MARQQPCGITTGKWHDFKLEAVGRVKAMMLHRFELPVYRAEFQHTHFHHRGIGCKRWCKKTKHYHRSDPPSNAFYCRFHVLLLLLFQVVKCAILLTR